MQGHARLEKLHRDSPYFELHGAFGDELDQLARTVRELRRRALDIRTTPVRRLLERLPRVVYDLARELGKRVRVELAGEEVEVDRGVLDHLDDALLHLVRNALDHGLESEAERTAAGKDPVGTLRLSAARVLGRLQLRIDEDGRGIDIEKVRLRAIERGLLVEMVAEDLPAERIRELIFEPGISTKDEVSGSLGPRRRADASSARSRRSAAHHRHERGRPRHDFPARSAVDGHHAARAGAAGRRPADRSADPVDRAVLSAAEAAVERAGVDSFFMFKDEPLPLVDLGPRIGLPSAPVGAGCVVVLEARGFKLGVLVERVVDDLEVFVRETPEPLGELSHLGGVAILRDGAPVFLLEIGSLVENFG
jgi:chemotaxis protein histidine kinase CheA